MTEATPAIGLFREKPLHAALKRWYARPGDRIEVPVDGYVIDLVRGDLLIEIQTRSFASLKRKLAALLELGHRVRIVHPIAVDRWIMRLDDDGSVMGRRRSPRHGVPADAFGELTSIARLLGHPDLEIELLLTREEEVRRHTPGRSWRRRGWSIEERRLVEVLEARPIRDVDDLARLLPAGLPERFTTADLARSLGRPRRTAQQMAYCLRVTGVIVPVGRQRHAMEYRLGD